MSRWPRRSRPGAAGPAAALLGLIAVIAVGIGVSLGALLASAQAPAPPSAPDAPPPPPPPETAAERAERLAQYRNLGKAFYENPTTQYEAVEQFAAALALAPDSPRERLNHGLALIKAGKIEEGRAELEQVQKEAPEIPHTWFNLGILAKRDARYPEAIMQFRRMVELVPDEPASHYNLGTLYELEGDGAAAVGELETAARLDPALAAPHFRLYNLYRRAGREKESARELATFRALKEGQKGAAVPEDTEWSWYSEIYDPPAPAPPGSIAPPSAVAFTPRELPGRVDSKTAGLAVLDADGDGRPDLLAWSKEGIALFVGSDLALDPAAQLAATGRGTRLGGVSPVRARPLRGLRAAGGGPPRRPSTPLRRELGSLADVVDVAAGDFDDDGLPDLCVLARAVGVEVDAPIRPLLVANRGGRFEPVAGDVAKTLPAGRFDRAVWLDFDHDYDLDLVLLGEDAALVRNQGAGGWSDETARFPFIAGRATGAALLDVVADSQGFDLAVAYADRPGVLYRDRLGGVYQAADLPDLPAGARDLVAADVDGDGWTDLAAIAPGAPGAGAETGRLALLLNRRDAEHPGGSLAAVADPPAVAGPIAFADLVGRGTSELIAGDGVHAHLVHLGGGRFAAGTLPTGWPVAESEGAPAAALAAADFDGDGRTDLALVGADGTVRLLTNATPPAPAPAAAGHWLAVRLTGVKNPKLAAGAEVEIKAGSLFQKKLYGGVPLLFGLGTHPSVDTVRITWPNGLIQNETRQEADRTLAVEEAPRLSGSCPMIFTWNGERFEFVTDVLGVAPLGASAGDGTYFPVDHDEVVEVPAGALVAAPAAGGVGARLAVRVTEELREVSYLDQVRLLAVDHPADVEIFTNDKFKGPPFPEFRLFGVRRRVYPVSARDDAGRDVLDRLTARDRRYPDGFRRTSSGVAELHHLDLDFGSAAAPPETRALLVLSGWVDWADGSTFLAAAQESPAGLAMPYLQVKDADGRWRTVLEDMGMPAGKPKTIVVDLTGKFLSPSREVRIVTGLCVYWDEIFLAEEAGAPQTVITDLPPAAADLRFRGFSRPVIDPERKQPEAFDYQSWAPAAMWNPTPGLYTRYGDVAELLAEVDDRLVILGSGDELRLEYDAGALPALPAGWRRDYLIEVDGWAKDADANTAFSQTVEPLPFHGMSGYPYRADEHFPDDPEHRRWREEYNTRPALRLVRPLRAERGGGGSGVETAKD